MANICTAQAAIEQVKDGMTVMVGGFLNVGTPERLVRELVMKNCRNLTLISNDSGFPGRGVGCLQDNKQLKTVYTSYVGTHPEYGQGMENGDLNVMLTPQGTLAERIRAAGAGLGGFLTPTGVGTIAAQGKEEVVVDGRQYLLELPLRADVALIKAYKGDAAGNLIYRRSARNFNPLMATAAAIVIAEVEEIVPVGTLDPDVVVTPGILVDFLVQGGGDCD